MTKIIYDSAILDFLLPSSPDMNPVSNLYVA